jgi:hypothetical protein
MEVSEEFLAAKRQEAEELNAEMRRLYYEELEKLGIKP